MATAWVFVEEDPLVMDQTVDEELGLDGEGPGTGAGDAGNVGDAGGDEEYELVYESNKESDTRVTTGTECLFDAEELLEQLCVCNFALQIPS